MKKFYAAFAGLFLVLSFISCDDSDEGSTVPQTESSKEITSFSIDGAEITIDGTSISVVFPYGTELSSVTPSVSHNGVSINPDPASVTDFSSPVSFTVTAEDGTTAVYTVTVSNAERPAFNTISGTIEGWSDFLASYTSYETKSAAIDETFYIVALYYNYSDLSKVIAPTVTITDKVEISSDGSFTLTLLESVEQGNLVQNTADEWSTFSLTQTGDVYTSITFETKNRVSFRIYDSANNTATSVQYTDAVYNDEGELTYPARNAVLMYSTSDFRVDGTVEEAEEFYKVAIETEARTFTADNILFPAGWSWFIDENTSSTETKLMNSMSPEVEGLKWQFLQKR